MENFDELIGKTLEEAKEIIDRSIRIRINKEDGVSYFGTCDMNPNRLNVEIENKLISKINGIG